MMWYSINDSGSRFKCRIDHLSINEKTDLEMIADQCAQDFHNGHDGWEYDWPLNMTLYETENGQPVAKLSVERESEPVFYSRIIK